MSIDTEKIRGEIREIGAGYQKYIVGTPHELAELLDAYDENKVLRGTISDMLDYAGDGQVLERAAEILSRDTNHTPT